MRVAVLSPPARNETIALIRRLTGEALSAIARKFGTLEPVFAINYRAEDIETEVRRFRRLVADLQASGAEIVVSVEADGETEEIPVAVMHNMLDQWPQGQEHD